MPRFNFHVDIAVACIGMCAGVVLAQGNDPVDGGTLRGRITDTTASTEPN